MKLLQFILSITIILSSLYCSAFLFTYGIVVEDSLLLVISLLFLGIAYFFSRIIDIRNNEYTIKIIDTIYNYFYKDEE